MNEIELLYKNAGVYDFRYDCDVSFTDGQFGRITNCSRGEVKDYCTDKKYFKSAKVINYKHLYPPFTAEKQIKLLEFNYKYSRVPDIGYIIELKKYDCPHYEEYGAFDTFQEALCADINYHWEYFTEEEKEQIKGILNG